MKEEDKIGFDLIGSVTVETPNMGCIDVDKVSLGGMEATPNMGMMDDKQFMGMAVATPVMNSMDLDLSKYDTSTYSPPPDYDSDIEYSEGVPHTLVIDNFHCIPDIYIFNR